MSNHSNNTPFAAYIHIPFCRHKCSFCDFAAFAGVDELEDEYCRVVCREITERTARHSNHDRCDQMPLKSVFYGGGTPGYIDPQNLKSMHQRLIAEVGIAAGAEISLETTPHAITPEKLSSWREIGINRLSIGIESFHDSELTAMGRDHTREEALKGVALAAQSGIPSVCVDFMYGLPTQTLDSWKATLDKILELSSQYANINHISSYGLHLGGGSPLYSAFPKGSQAYPSDEEFAEMFALLVETLEGGGFGHYEVSNFAREGFQSVHNLNYWKNGEYLAFGVSAHRYLRPVRSANWRSLKRYMRDCTGDELLETIDRQTERKEAIMLALRTRKGIDIREFARRYELDFMESYRSSIEKLIDSGLMSHDNDRLFLTLEGFPIMNAIIAEFF